MIWSCLARTNRKTNNDLFRPQFFRRSDDIDDEFAGRFPRFDIALGLRNVGQQTCGGEPIASRMSTVEQASLPVQSTRERTARVRFSISDVME